MELTKTKYKQTEVGLIPNNWKVDVLENLANVIDPHPSHRAPAGVTNGIPFLGIGDLNENGEIIRSKFRRVDEKIYEEHKLRYNLNNDLIGLGRVASIGKVIRLKNNIGKYTISPTLGILDAKNIYNNYLFYTLNSTYIRNYFFKIMSGSTRSSVGMIVLRKIPIPLPPLPEQKAIAEVLSDVDSLIQAIEQKLAKKRAIKQGAMQKLLTPPSRTSGQVKEDWEVKKLGEIADVRDGTHESPDFVDNGVKFITSKNIIDGKLDFKNLKYISQIDADHFDRRSKVDKNDILMSMIGTIGNAVLIDYEPDFSIKNMALIKRKNSEVDFEYLIQLFHSDFFQNLIEGKLAGGIQRFISLGILRDLEISFPIKKEQTRIATILSDMDKEIELIEQQLAKYQVLKQGLMQELLTGRIRLTV